MITNAQHSRNDRDHRSSASLPLYYSTSQQQHQQHQQNDFFSSQVGGTTNTNTDFLRLLSHPKFELGTPQLGGTGCPANTASISVLQDETSNSWSVTILFDAYAATTSRTSTTVRKSCNIVIPVRVPSGFSTSLLAFDWRGNADIPAGARGKLNAQYFWAGPFLFFLFSFFHSFFVLQQLCENRIARSKHDKRFLRPSK